MNITWTITEELNKSGAIIEETHVGFIDHPGLDTKGRTKGGMAVVVGPNSKDGTYEVSYYSTRNAKKFGNYLDRRRYDSFGIALGRATRHLTSGRWHSAARLALAVTLKGNAE